ncbi:hypothetical protein EIQ14_22300 [Xanthomonas campestris pv. campestris]
MGNRESGIGNREWQELSASALCASHHQSPRSAMPIPDSPLSIPSPSGLGPLPFVVFPVQHAAGHEAIDRLAGGEP